VFERTGKALPLNLVVIL